MTCRDQKNAVEPCVCLCQPVDAAFVGGGSGCTRKSASHVSLPTQSEEISNLCVCMEEYRQARCSKDTNGQNQQAEGGIEHVTEWTVADVLMAIFGFTRSK